MFLSEIMSIYLLATLIQLRTSLPPNFGTGTGEMAGDGALGTGAGAGAVDAGEGGSSLGQGTAPGVASQLLLSSLPDFNTAFGALFGECSEIGMPRRSTDARLRSDRLEGLDTDLTFIAPCPLSPDATFLLSALVTLLGRWFMGTQESVLFGAGALGGGGSGGGIR